LKNHSVGTELFHANRQTDRQTDKHYEANSHFHIFFNILKNEILQT